MDPLVAALRYEDTIYTSKVAEALVKIGAPAVPSLVGALKSNSTSEIAARALVQIGEPAVEPLIALLNEDDPFLQVQAADLLGEMGDGRAVDPLIVLLKNTSPELRQKAAIALGRIEDAARWKR